MNGQSHAFGHKPPGAPPDREGFTRLACSIADHARHLGLTVVRLRPSRILNSPSQHLHLRDRSRRDWYLRLSDHRGPSCTGHEVPHFDLVTRDCATGTELAYGFVERIARGEQAWEPTERARARKGVRPVAKRPRR